MGKEGLRLMRISHGLKFQSMAVLIRKPFLLSVRLQHGFLIADHPRLCGEKKTVYKGGNAEWGDE